MIDHMIHKKPYLIFAYDLTLAISIRITFNKNKYFEEGNKINIMVNKKIFW